MVRGRRQVTAKSAVQIKIIRPEAKLTKSGTQSSSVTSNDGTWG